MAFVEEIFENGGKLFGAHTGKQYPKGCVEEINGMKWSKPRYYQPNAINIEIEEKEESEDNTNRDEQNNA